MHSVRCWRGEALIHPDIEMLRRYRDGEPVADLKDAIEAHLSECDWCRGQLLLIECEASPAPADGVVFETGAGELSALLGHLRNWEAGRPAPQVRGPMIRQRAAREIALFLGDNAALQIIQPVSDDGGNLVPAIRPTLDLFLGLRAAAHLSSHIVEVAVVRA